jgi:hypothetical protein
LEIFVRRIPVRIALKHVRQNMSATPAQQLATTPVGPEMAYKTAAGMDRCSKPKPVLASLDNQEVAYSKIGVANFVLTSNCDSACTVRFCAPSAPAAAFS